MEGVKSAYRFATALGSFSSFAVGADSGFPCIFFGLESGDGFDWLFVFLGWELVAERALAGPGHPGGDAVGEGWHRSGFSMAGWWLGRAGLVRDWR
jgi:hypothetical protein